MKKRLQVSIISVLSILVTCWAYCGTTFTVLDNELSRGRLRTEGTVYKLTNAYTVGNFVCSITADKGGYQTGTDIRYKLPWVTVGYAYYDFKTIMDTQEIYLQRLYKGLILSYYKDISNYDGAYMSCGRQFQFDKISVTPLISGNLSNGALGRGAWFHHGEVSVSYSPLDWLKCGCTYIVPLSADGRKCLEKKSVDKKATHVGFSVSIIH